MQVVESPAESPIGRRHPMDAVIAKAARCADPRSTYTPLFFSENPAEAARAKAICARCTVRCLCLARALQRGEPFGVWGGEFIVDGEVVAMRRGRGRPRKVALPTTVDEVTGDPRPHTWHSVSSPRRGCGGQSLRRSPPPLTDPALPVGQQRCFVRPQAGSSSTERSERAQRANE